jgi:hypothetical protein
MGTVLCTCQFEPPVLRSRKDRRTSSQPSQTNNISFATHDSSRLPAVATTLVLTTATIDVAGTREHQNPLAPPSTHHPSAFTAMMEDDATMFEPQGSNSEFSSNTTLHGRFPSLEIPPMMRAEMAAARQSEGPLWNAPATPQALTTPRGDSPSLVEPSCQTTSNHGDITHPDDVVNDIAAVNVGGSLSSRQRASNEKLSRSSSHSRSSPAPLVSLCLGTTAIPASTMGSPKLLRVAEVNTDTLVFSFTSPPLAQRMNSTDTSSLLDYKPASSLSVVPPPSSTPLLGAVMSRQSTHEPMSMVASLRHRMMPRATSTLSSTYIDVDSHHTVAADDAPLCCSGTAAMMAGARPLNDAAGLPTRNPLDASTRTMSVVSFASPHAHSTMSSRGYSPRVDSPLFEQIASPVHLLDATTSQP